MRDYRVDFVRGLALIVIFIDHIPFNIYSYLTPRNYGLSDAAEIFVLVSGVSAALAYFGRFSGGERLLASGLAIKRSITLYVAQLFGTIAMLGLFAGAALYLEKPEILDRINIPQFLADPIEGLAGVVTLGHQLGFFNILPMYIIFLLMLPAIMFLAQRSLSLAFAVSFGVYLFSVSFRINFPNFPTPGGWFFNPLAWQFLFTIGFVFGVRLKRDKPLLFHPWLNIAAMSYLIISALWVMRGWWGSLPDLPLPFVLYGSDKTFLTMNRLLHVLAAAYVFAQSPLATILKRRLTAANPMVLIGRYGLVSFCLGTLLSMIGLLLKEELGGKVIFDTLYVGCGLTVLAAVAAALDLMRRRQSRPRNTAPEAEIPPAGALAVAE